MVATAEAQEDKHGQPGGKPKLTKEYCELHLPAHTPESFGRAFVDAAIRQAAQLCQNGQGEGGFVEYNCKVKVEAVPVSTCISICVTTSRTAQSSARITTPSLACTNSLSRQLSP